MNRQLPLKETPLFFHPKGVKFVEAKEPDMALVGTLLTECSAVNQWANFGPLYHRLMAEYTTHMSVPEDQALIPCANAGIGLEMLARTQAFMAGKPKLRWIGPAFSFKILGRGYFADMHFWDCDTKGLLDLAALHAAPADSYDGIIVTNPFGLARDFEAYIDFATATGKALIIDNAAGLDQIIPDWPWQVFSLHHTKVYGFGEGGLVLAPAELQAFMTRLISYDEAPQDPALWINNGKISDVACAFLIARLRGFEEWAPRYEAQRKRVAAAFGAFGAQPLLAIEQAPLGTGLPVLLGHPFDEATAEHPTRFVDITRQYPPLAPLPQVTSLFAQLLVYPAHPGLEAVSDAALERDIAALMGQS